jgi:hypothetical protein
MRNFDSIMTVVREGREIFFPFKGKNVSQQAGFTKKAKQYGRKQNPIAANQADIVNWILYDRISFAPLATLPQLYKLFVAPIGSGTKTKVDTNLDQVSRLPDPQWFNVTGFSIFFNHDVAPVDLTGFLATTYMEFWVGSKVYLEGPLDCFPNAGGVWFSGVSNVTAGATVYATSSNNGWPSVNNLYDVRLPAGLNLGTSGGAPVVSDGVIGITILQGQTFNVQFKADGGGATLAANNAVPYVSTGLTVGCRLHGILSRGVQ